MRYLIRRLCREKHAQDLVEYALLAAIISVGVLLVLNGVTSALNTQFTSIAAQVGGAGRSSGGTAPSGSGSGSGSGAGGSSAASGSGESGSGSSGNNGNHAGGGNNGNGRGNGA